MGYTGLMKCETCNKPHKKKRFCSKECYWESMKGLKNELAPNWKGENVSVNMIHQWLKANYGQPRVCELGNCTRQSIAYDWALKTGMTYKKDRNCFMRLCRSCHRRYDLTEEKKKKAIENLWWNQGIKNPAEKHYIKKGQVLNPKGIRTKQIKSNLEALKK